MRGILRGLWLGIARAASGPPVRRALILQTAWVVVPRSGRGDPTSVTTRETWSMLWFPRCLFARLPTVAKRGPSAATAVNSLQLKMGAIWDGPLQEAVTVPLDPPPVPRLMPSPSMPLAVLKNSLHPRQITKRAILFPSLCLKAPLVTWYTNVANILMFDIATKGRRSHPTHNLAPWHGPLLERVRAPLRPPALLCNTWECASSISA
mmetsp:Transcript_10868/g.17192  ORF Transcript_10868/g.17192 Transcript_10868/m.17192 type:complete len:207 (+) Transcript_10868:366-986(+)